MPQVMKHSLRIAVIYIFVLANCPLHGQLGHHRFQNFTIRDGLPSNWAHCTVTDHLGFVWVGTEDGLARFNGQSFETFRDREPMVPNEQIYDLIATPDSNVLISSVKAGLILYDYETDEFRNLSEIQDTLNLHGLVRTRRLSLSTDGTLWLGTSDGSYKSNYFTRQPGEPTLTKQVVPGYIRSLTIINDSVSIHTMWEGIKSYNSNTNKITKLPLTKYLSTPSPTVSMIYDAEYISYPNRLIYLGETGIFDYHLKDETSKLIYEFVPGQTCRKITRYNDNTLLFPTTSGMLTLDIPSLKFQDYEISQATGLTSPDLTGGSVDQFGNLWITSWTNGVYMLKSYEQNFSRKLAYDPAVGINNLLVNDLAIKDSAVFFLDSKYRLCMLDKNSGNIKRLLTNHPEIDQRASLIEDLEHGNLLLSGNQVSFIYNYLTDQIIYPYLTHPKRKNVIARNISQIDQNRYVLIPWDDCIYFLNENKPTDYSLNRVDVQNLSGNRIKCIASQPNGKLLLGTLLGLKELDTVQSQVSSIQSQHALMDNIDVNDILVQDSSIWIATVLNGLIRYDPFKDHLSQYLLDDEPGHDEILKVLHAQGKTEIWMSTTGGLAVLDYKTEILQFFYERDGLISNHFSSSAEMDNQGNMYFGGWGGLIYFNPEDVRLNQIEGPRIQITGFELLDTETFTKNKPLSKSIFRTKHIYLGHDHNDFRFDFANLNHNFPNSLMQYRLKGYQDAWSFANGTSAFFTNIDPGNYIFQVRGKNSQGTWDDPISISISISPPWWQTWWFRILAVMTVIVLILIFLRWRTERLKADQAILENKIQEKTTQLLATQEELVRSEKMTALGTLTAGIAHEINNPLNYIQGGLYHINELLRQNAPTKDTDLLEESVQTMQVGIGRIKNIVTELDYLNSQTRMENEWCDIEELLDTCLTILPSDTDDNIKVTKKYQGKNHKIHGNKVKLNRLFYNVLNNARQSITDKGLVSVQTWENSHQYYVRIQDSGHGISEESKLKVTDPFYTTKDPGQGMGLGLSVAYQIVKDHHGKFHIESTPGVGTTVMISFPIVSKAS